MDKIFFYIIVLTILFSCSDSVSKREIINEDDFFNLLIDMHKADGIISDLNLTKNKKSDSVSVYNSVLKKHNISREYFDKTIKYYSKHTEEYLLIYDSLENYFDSIQSMLTKKRTNNLWKKKEQWSFNTFEFKNPLDFNIKTKKHGQYFLEYDISEIPEDTILTSRIKMFANYSDDSKDSAVNVEKTKSLRGKDFEHIKININTDKRKKLNSISGNILDFDNSKKAGVRIKNIELHFKEIKTQEMTLK